MAHPNHNAPLTFFCQNNSSLKTKIGLLTLNHLEYSKLLNYILILIEYLQLMSQVLLVYPNSSLENLNQPDTYIFTVITYFFKLINPSYLLPYSKSDSSLTSHVLLIIACYMFLKYLLFLYIVLTAYFNTKQSHFLLVLWRNTFKLQARIMCYFISSFWMRTVLTVSNGTYGIEHIGNGVLIGISCCLIALEYLFSFFLEMQFCDLLPTNTLLANKTLEPQLITLAQKFLVQITQLALYSSPLATIRVVGTVNIIISVFRDFRFFTILPLYNFNTLSYQKNLLAVTTALSYSCLIQIILYAADYQTSDIRVIVCVWVAFAILNLKFYHGLINKIFISLVSSHIEKRSPKFLIHKIIASQHVRSKEYRHSQRSEKYDFFHLLHTNETVCLARVFGLDPTLFKPKNLDLQNSRKANKIFVHYLENLSTKYPKNSIIKLNLAYFCTRDPKFYSKTLKAIASFEQKTLWSKYSLSASLLLVYMEKLILSNCENFKSNLDLFTFTKSQLLVDHLKTEIFKQTDLKVSICENILKEKCDIGEIFDAAQIIGQSTDSICKDIDNIFHKIPDHYIQPLLLVAEYNLVLNYTIKDCKKYFSAYLKKFNKYQKYFVTSNLIKENIYQSKNAYLLISGEKIDNGHIVYCSRSIENICGEGRPYYSGRHISSLFIPSLQNFFARSLKKIFEMGEKSLMNKVIKAYLRHKDGHLVEAELYMEVHPYISEKLYVSMIIHPIIPPSEEFMIVNEAGEVEGATKTIFKALCLKEFLTNQPGQPLKVQALSEELAKVNEVCNAVQKFRMNNEKAKKNSIITKDFLEEEDDGQIVQNHLYNSLDLDTQIFSTTFPKGQRRNLLDLYTQYSNEGKTIALRSLKQQATPRKTRRGSQFYLGGAHHYYHCEVSTFSYRLTTLKLFKLRRLTDDEEEDFHQENIRSLQIKIQNNLQPFADEEDEEEEVESSRVPSSEEENSENINAEEMPPNTTEVLRTQWKSDTIPTTQENLISPRSNRALLFPTTTARGRLDSPLKSPLSVSVLIPSVDQTNPQKPKLKTKSPQRKEREIHYQPSNHSSQTSTSSDSNKIFKKAILTKSYPLTFEIFYKFFYAIIAITLVSQIILKLSSDDTMKDLVFKKDMLGDLQFRAYWMIKIQVVARGAYLQTSGLLSTDDFQIPDPNRTFSVALLKSFYPPLMQVNKQIIAGAYALEDARRQDIFAKDVRAFGSYLDEDVNTSITVTSFQMVDQVSNAVRKWIVMEDPASNESLPTLEFLIYNTLNDFQTKNEQISDLLVASIEDQKASFQIIRILCLVITPLLLAGTAFTLALIILAQYRLEKDCLLAFIKLDRKGIKDLLDSFKSFRKRLENGECFEHKRTLTDLMSFHVSIDSNQAATYNKNSSDQLIEYSKIKKRHFGYIVNVFCYSVILLGIMIWNYVYSTNATDAIYRLEGQIQYANSMSDKFSLLYSSFVETFFSNNTNYITTKLPYEYMVQGLEEVRTIQSQISKVFMKPNKEYYPEIYEVLFENGGCSQLILVSSQKYCQNYYDADQPTNLLSLISLFESTLRNEIIAYNSLDKSSYPDLIETALANVDSLLPASSIISAKAQLLVDLLGQRISRKINESFSRRTLIIIVFLVAFTVASVAFWWKILSRVGEVSNNFKRVLQVYPVDFVLSSFLIKLFLKKTCKEIGNF